MEDVPNFQLFSSQNQDLDNEQLDEIGQKPQVKNIKRATEWGIKKFDKWCEKRKITVDLKTVSPTDLSEILREFFAEVETEKGQALTPKCIDWNQISHSSPSNLCSIQPKHKQFARQRIHICQQNSKGQAIYETMRNQNINHLFSQEICRN